MWHTPALNLQHLTLQAIQPYSTLGRCQAGWCVGAAPGSYGVFTPPGHIPEPLGPAVSASLLRAGLAGGVSAPSQPKTS